MSTALGPEQLHAATDRGTRTKTAARPTRVHRSRSRPHIGNMVQTNSLELGRYRRGLECFLARRDLRDRVVLAEAFRVMRSGSFFRPVSRFHSSNVWLEIFPSTRSCANFRRCAWLLNGIARSCPP